MIYYDWTLKRFVFNESLINGLNMYKDLKHVSWIMGRYQQIPKIKGLIVKVNGRSHIIKIFQLADDTAICF